MTVPLAELPGISALSRDYFQKPDRTAAFFNGDFRDADAFARQAEWVRTRAMPRQALVEILHEQNRRFGCGPETLARIDRLIDPRTGAIVTGQQVGLFGGPLYTIYKALTAVILADSLEKSGPSPMVPVFWLAADDHDLTEIDHVTVLDRENRLQVIRCLLAPAESKIPVSQVALPGEISHAIEGLADAIHDTEFKAAIIAALGEDYAPGRSPVEAFACWLTRWFKPFGLIFLDPADPRLRELGKEVFLREIDGDSPSTARALETTRRLTDAGYTGQVHLHPGRLNLFYCDPERRGVRFSEAGFAIKERPGILAKAELANLVREKPALFSPNVLLRPILQDTLLPTVATIAGPGEIAYFAQMKGIYAEFGLSMPIIQPRISLTLLERRAAQFLEKYHLQIRDIWAPPQTILQTIAPIPDIIHERLEGFHQQVEAGVTSLEADIAAIDPSFPDILKQTRSRIVQQVDYLAKKIEQTAAQRDESIGRQLRKTTASLFPGGTLQERVFNIVPFLVRDGPGLIERLSREIAIDGVDHQVVEL